MSSSKATGSSPRAQLGAEMLDQPAAHRRICFEIGQRVQQRFMRTAFVKPMEGVGADGVICFEQSQKIAGSFVGGR
jgi:hypothetical protein